MSGRRLSKSERSILSQSKRYVRTSRESEFHTVGNNVESTRYSREVARIGKVGR